MAGGTVNSEVDGAVSLFAALDRLAERYGSEPTHRDDSLDSALDAIGVLFDQLMTDLATLPDVIELSQLSAFVERISARRLVVAAQVSGSTSDSRADRRRARDVLGNGSASSQTQARDAKRAAAISANPELGDAVAGGSITPDAIDHLGKAANTATGAIPDELVGQVDGLTADQTAHVVERYMADRVNVDDVEERYRRQLNARSVRRYRTHGLAGIAVEGPDALVHAIWEHLNQYADARYRADGGRDTPAQKQTPLDHRRFDALHACIAGEKAGSGTNGRATVVVTINADQLNGDDGQPIVGTQIGAGPLPNELLMRYLHQSPIHVLLRDSIGSPLWLGRTKRHATSRQFLALAVRDTGCVLCRAPINRCEAHHLIPWTAPGRGRTDIDQMALLCGRCHRELHHRNRTLHRQQGPSSANLWSTRPATPHETPQAAPRHRQLE